MYKANIIQIQAPRFAHFSVGVVGKGVGIVKTLLTRYCSKESDWSYYLKMCVLFYNPSFVASIGVAPCQIMNGRLPWWPFDLKLLAPKPISIHQLQTTLQLGKKYVVKTFQHSQKKTKKKIR